MSETAVDPEAVNRIAEKADQLESLLTGMPTHEATTLLCSMLAEVICSTAVSEEVVPEYVDHVVGVFRTMVTRRLDLDRLEDVAH